MKISELTAYQKQRLCNCIYCGRKIKEDEEFQMIRTKKGRYSIYTFIHKDCIYAAKEWLKHNMVKGGR